MADAKAVLKEAIDEGRLMAGGGGRIEELQVILRLIHKAYYSEDGTVPDRQVREALHSAKWERLGVDDTIEPDE